MFSDYKEFIAGMWAFNGNKAVEFINQEIEHTLIMGNFAAVDCVIGYLISQIKDDYKSIPILYLKTIAKATEPAADRLNKRSNYIELITSLIELK